MPQEILDSSQRIGINQIPSTTALAGLQHAIEANDTLITIADVSWDRFLPAFTARRSHPLLTELASRANASETSSSTSTASASGLREKLAGQTAEQQLHTLTTLVASATATVLAHPDPGALDTDLAFKDLGIDSLTALELRNTLTTHTGLTLPATLVFDHPTPTAVANHIHHQLCPDGGIGQAGYTHDSEIHQLIASIPVKRLREAGIVDTLLRLVGSGQQSQPNRTEDVANMNLNELLSVLGDSSE